MNRKLAGGLLAGLLLPGLTACGAGFEAETRLVQADNTGGATNGLLARAIVVVKGKQALSAALAGTLINRSNRADVLSVVTLTDRTPGAPTITVNPNITLEPGQLLPMGVGEFPPITIPDARSLKVGNFVDVVLQFRDAGALHLQVATADRILFYSEVIPRSSGLTEAAKQKITTKEPAGAKKKKPAQAR